LGLLNSAVAAYYYLRVVVVMYMQPPAEDGNVLEAPSTGIAVTMWATAVATVLLGVVPGFVLDFAGRSADLAR
jgi:NADH-quinone oxidoreductase subunit N